MSIINYSDLERIDKTKTVLIDCRNIMDKFDESLQLAHKESVEPSVHIPQIPFMFKFDGINEGRHPLPEQSVIDSLYATLTNNGDYGLLLFADENSFFHTRLYYLFLLYGYDGYLYNDDYKTLENISNEFKTLEVELPIQFDSTESIFQRDIHLSMENLEEKMENNVLLIDVRSEERYLGITEPIDYKKGHIPGAVNIPNNLIYKDGMINLAALDRMMDKLRGYEEVIVYCGSGMSATPMFTLLHHNDINVKVYGGSFSEWITDDSNPVEMGPNIIEGVNINGK